MKAAGIILILISCSGLGFQMAWLFHRRIDQCRKIERCLQYLSGEIRFHQLPLSEALREAGRREKGQREAEYSKETSNAGKAAYIRETKEDGFQNFMIRLADRLDERGGAFEELWTRELETYLRDSLLKEESELLFRLGRQLGNLDLEEQQKTLNQFLEQWREWIDGLCRQEEKKGRLYRYLGVAAGFFLAILLM